MPRGENLKGRKIGGRQKGTPNKITVSVKQSVLEALHAGDGATAFFMRLKLDDPKTFATLCGKLLPRELTGADGKDLIPGDRSWKEMSFEERRDIARRAAFMLSEAKYAGENGKYRDGTAPTT